MDHSPWGHKESGTAERLSLTSFTEGGREKDPRKELLDHVQFLLSRAVLPALDTEEPLHLVRNTPVNLGLG